MKIAMLVVCSVLGVGGIEFGAQAKQVISLDCYTNNAPAFQVVYEKILKDGIAKIGKKRNIAFDLSTFVSGYAAWLMSPDQVVVSANGFVRSTDGTPFSTSIVAWGGETQFLPLLESAGFDHEGNAVNGHCLMSQGTTDGNPVSVAIKNANTGRLIGSFATPTILKIK